MKILIINFGWIGDSILASSLAENCKLNGYEQVDLLLGFPQTAEMLMLNPK
jgi:ADP-heptose:LPS heptosyltransferase